MSLDATGSTATVSQRTRVPVEGGTLVYEPVVEGVAERELVGFNGVTDWNKLTEAVIARGHDRGAVTHLPELDGGGQRA